MTSDPTATASAPLRGAPVEGLEEEGGDVVGPESVRAEEGDDGAAEELGEDLAEAHARADLTARWFIRSGMRPPSEEHHRAVMLAAEELPELDDVDAPGAPMPPTPPTPPAAGSR
jgi:hypothetical protein